MIKVIEKKNLKLYDGEELELRNAIFSIDVNGIFVKIKVLDFYNNPLRNITSIINQEELENIVTVQNFEKTRKLFIDYKSINNLDIYYCQHENLILLFSMGEFQPGRYLIFLEGMWVFSE